jgi:hypothetical protein
MENFDGAGDAFGYAHPLGASGRTVSLTVFEEGCAEIVAMGVAGRSN